MLSASDVLIRQARAGDLQALDRLLREWYPALLGFARQYFQGRFAPEVADELMREAVQRTCLSVHRSLGQLREVEAFKTWLYRIATHQCYEEERRWRKRGKTVVAMAHLSPDEERAEGRAQEPVADGLPPDEGLHRESLAAQVRAALADLPEEQRVVLIMKEYEGLKFREIAETLGLSENTVKSRLYYALKHLRKNLPRWQRIREEMEG